MQLDDYRAYTTALTRNLANDPRVLGLIALGSMAEQDYLPDQWSDHDFFVVTVPGQQEAFRTDLSWLPDHQRIMICWTTWRPPAASTRSIRSWPPGWTRPPICRLPSRRCASTCRTFPSNTSPSRGAMLYRSTGINQFFRKEVSIDDTKTK